MANVINPNNNMNSNIICPVCGAHFAMPAPVLPPVKPHKGKAELVIEALKKRGVDTSKFHALNIGSESVVGYESGGTISPVSYDSSIFDGIDIEGTINNPYLFRRWIVSQLAHMEFIERQSRWCHHVPAGVHKELQRKGYEYSWRVMVNEFKAQARMERQVDLEELAKRHRWYDKECARRFLQHYVDNLVSYFDGLKRKSCKGRAYITSHGVHIFVDRVVEIVLDPLRNRIDEFDKCTTVTQMYHALRDFRKLSFVTNGRQYRDHVFVLYSDTKMCPAFVDAYKGCGAYYALDNMIRFMNCVITTRDGRVIDEQQSLKYIEEYAGYYANRKEGYKLLGMWKKFVSDNNIDFNAKATQWASERRSPIAEKK